MAAKTPPESQKKLLSRALRVVAKNPAVKAKLEADFRDDIPPLEDDAPPTGAALVEALSPGEFVAYRALCDAAECNDQLQYRLCVGFQRNLVLIVDLPTTAFKSAFKRAFHAWITLAAEASQAPLTAQFSTVEIDRFNAEGALREIFVGAFARHVVVLKHGVTPGNPTRAIETIADAQLELVMDPDYVSEALVRRFGDDARGVTLAFDPLAFDPALFDLATAQDYAAGVEQFYLAMADDASERAEFQRTHVERADGSWAPKSAEGAVELEPDEDGLVVLGDFELDGRSSDTKSFLKLYKPLAGKRVPLVEAKDMWAMRPLMLRDWPHAKEIIDALFTGLIDGEPFRVRPILLVGEPGCGKTTILTELARYFSLPSVVYPCASVADGSFGGTPAQWSTRRSSVPLELIRNSEFANPVVILDELEKTGISGHNGSLVHALLPMLERHSAATYFETALEMKVDLSAVNFLATANSLDIPDPLKDRFRVIRMPDPGPEHIGVLSKRIIRDIARERGFDERFIEPLDGEEIEVIRREWPGGSLRRLGRAVRATIETRERLQVMQ